MVQHCSHRKIAQTLKSNSQVTLLTGMTLNKTLHLSRCYIFIPTAKHRAGCCQHTRHLISNTSRHASVLGQYVHHFRRQQAGTLQLPLWGTCQSNHSAAALQTGCQGLTTAETSEPVHFWLQLLLLLGRNFLSTMLQSEAPFAHSAFLSLD